MAGCAEKTFLQSWNWGIVQEKMGNKVWRLGAFDGQDLLSTVLVVVIKAKRGKFLLVQHGPNIKTQNWRDKQQILKALLEELKKLSKQEGCSFIRIAPLLPRDNERMLKELGFRQAPMHANAYEATWKLNIEPSEDELMKNMRKTTRYLIRQAKKNPDLEIVKSAKTEDVKLYDKLNQQVAGHRKFTPFSCEFIKNEFDVFAKDNQALLFFGKYQGKIIASALVIFWSKTGFYHQAALSPEYHKIPMAYLLQWEAINEARARGCSYYDFWGYIDPDKEPGHPWSGPTFFKMGFGGQPREYVKTQDFPLSGKYCLVFIFEKIRKFRRGL